MARRAYLYFLPRTGAESPQCQFLVGQLATLEHALENGHGFAGGVVGKS